MKFQKILLLSLIMLIASCASTRPKEYTNYEEQLVAPAVIDEFILTNKHVYEEPSLGASLSYENRDFPGDNITVYVYPIAAVNWDDQDSVLAGELSNTLAEIDAAVQQGYYQSRTAETLSDYAFESQDREYKGKKAEFTLTSDQGVLFYSDAYLFLAEDKFVKFRTSFSSELVNQSMGDSAVKSILSNLGIPPESIYMKQLRAEHEQRRLQSLMNLIQQAVENSKTTSNETESN